MKVVPSAMFRTTCFPHEGKIITVDQLDFCTSDLRSNTNSNVPLIGNYSMKYEIIGICLFKDSSLMGIFPSSPPNPPPTVPINMILGHTSYDRWILLDSNKIYSYGTTIPLSPIEKYYMAIQSAETPLKPTIIHH